MDAVVATALASSVADPCNIGIAGYGGYLVVHGSGEPHATCVQFPLSAPAAIPAAALARTYPEEGPESSSVPGVLGGLERALAELGSLPWSRVCEPAIRLARAGVVANATVRRALEQNRHRAFVAECFAIDESPDRLLFRQPALAATLESIAEKGARWFREGPLGEAACRAWAAARVPVSIDEWRRQDETAERVAASLHDADGVCLFGAPVELSGAAVVAAAVAAARRIGAPALGSNAGLADLALEIGRIWERRLGKRAAPETAHTAHMNAADAGGRVAALTATHGPAWFGGRWAIPGSGVIMNAGMHNFSRGALVARGARRLGLSNMSPTIALDSRGHRLAIGCPGARRIPSNIALVLARHFVSGLSLHESVAAGRLHAEDTASVAYEEGRTEAALLRELSKRFASVQPLSWDDYFGPLTAIRASATGEVETAVDDRQAAGYSAVVTA